MRRESAEEFGRYFLVQVAAYAVEWGAFLAARYLGVDLLVANVIAKSAALVFAFFCHRAFTFRVRNTDVVKQALRYFFAFLASATASTFLLWVLEPVLAEWLAKFVSDVAIVLASFLIAKTLVFQRADARGEAEG